MLSPICPLLFLPIFLKMLSFAASEKNTQQWVFFSENKLYILAHVKIIRKK